MIDFYDEKDENIYSFQIDPTWRIVLDGKIIINSFNYPYHENYSKDEEEKETKDFYEWCSKTDFMKYEKIKNIKILNSCDLIIEGENGAVLNNFMKDIDYHDYSFYDKINNKIYRFNYGKIIQENWERKYKRGK
jgi:hypothetical protein